MPYLRKFVVINDTDNAINLEFEFTHNQQKLFSGFQNSNCFLP